MKLPAARVSVVIPTHNRSRLLAMTLYSVLWQRDVDLEVIVVDDGSTDDTSAMVGSLTDPRVRLLRHAFPHGVSAARNRGIDDAESEWIAFLDDDDVWAPDKLTLQLRAATETGATWVYAGAVKIDENQGIVGGSPPPPPTDVMSRLPQWSLVPGGCSGVLVARTSLSEAGLFDPQLVNLADWDLWIRLARIGPAACSRSALVGYRLHRGQSSLDVGLILREAGLVEEKYGMPLDRGALHHYLAHKCLLSGRRLEAVEHLARAAVRGEAGPVVNDMWLSARGRVRRQFPGPASRSPHPHAQWREQASAWLIDLSNDGDLRRAGTADNPTGPSSDQDQSG